MNKLSPDGKMNTIRRVNNTHEDFAKLVQLGKNVLKEIKEIEEKTNTTEETLFHLLQEGKGNESCDNTGKTILEIYTVLAKKHAELDAYRNTYHTLMEDGVDEILASIDIGPKDYDYDFYELCLEF